MERKSTEERQVEIKNAMLKIAAIDGISKLTTKNLANEIGVSEGTIFKHYKNKSEIIHAIVSDVEKDLVDQLDKISKKIGPAREILKEYFEYHINYLKEHRGVTILLFALASYENDDILKKNLNRILSRQKEYVGEIVKNGGKSNEWVSDIDTDSFATIYMGIPITMNISMNLSKGKFDYKDFSEKMYNMLERTLGIF